MKPSAAKSKTTSEAIAKVMAALGAPAKVLSKKRKPAAHRIKVARWVKPTFAITVRAAHQD
jgi:flagellar biosynthesis GTPase FlhF